MIVSIDIDKAGGFLIFLFDSVSNSYQVEQRLLGQLSASMVLCIRLIDLSFMGNGDPDSVFHYCDFHGRIPEQR